MTHTEYRAALARLGLTQTGAASLIGVDARTTRRWASGATDIPLTVERLLWACERDPTLLGELLEGV